MNITERILEFKGIKLKNIKKNCIASLWTKWKI